MRIRSVGVAWPIMGKYNVVHKTGSTKRIALSSEEDRATATGNMFRKFCEVWTSDFEISERTDVETRDRQTVSLIAILRIPAGGEVLIKN